MEQPPNIPPPKKENNSENKAKKLINATLVTAFVAGASGAIPNEAKAKEKIASSTTPQVETKKDSQEKTIENLDEQVFSYVRGLGMFGKLGLVNDIKEHGESIKSFLKDGIHDTEKTQSIFSKSGTELKTVLSLYIKGLKDIEKRDPSLSRRAISKTNDLIGAIQNSSILELQERFK